MLGGAAGPTWIYRALVLLVISCPCALVISTPVSIVSALAAAARKGVLIKGGARLERWPRCAAWRSTRPARSPTGRLAVTDVISTNGMPPARILALAASLETRSEHPLGRAIVERAAHDGLPILTASGFQSLPGRGAVGVVDRDDVIVGSHRLFEERSLCSPVVEQALDSLASHGRSTVLVEQYAT